MKTKLTENQIRARFASRRWAVNLSINAEPLNHNLPDPPSSSWIVYWCVRSETADAAVERFRYALTRIAAKLRIGPTVFSIVHLQKCAAPVIVEWLTVLLSTGQAGPLPDGSQVSLNLDNLIVNICLEENDPDTAEVVERILGKSVGGTVAGMSKMPDHQPGRKEDRARPTHWGSRRARTQPRRGASGEE